MAHNRGLCAEKCTLGGDACRKMVKYYSFFLNCFVVCSHFQYICFKVVKE